MSNNMQNTGFIVLIEPHETLQHPNSKLANLYMNRLMIDEEVANELLGIYFLKQYGGYDGFCSIPDAVKIERIWYYNSKVEVQIQIKQLNCKTVIFDIILKDFGIFGMNLDPHKLYMPCLLQTVFEFKIEKNDFEMVNAALRSASRNPDLTTHFICMTSYYNEFDHPNDSLQRFKETFIDGMTNYRIESAVLTIADTMRERLVTTEVMTDHYRGKYARRNGCVDSIFEHSLNDDLEIFYDKLKLGQVTTESVLTFCFRKLTEKEMKLVNLKDEYHMASYAASESYKDVDDTEMKMSDSKSKFVLVISDRYTFVFSNHPINHSFKVSIENCEQCEDEPR